MATVSVIIPNYNHGRYLTQRIRSVLEQTFEDFEVIILDDCSTDDSRAVIERFRDNKRVRSIEFNSRNSGSPFKQWERGVSLSSGKYVWIAESDDFASPDLLKTLLKYLEAGCDLAYCRSDVVDETGALINGYYWPDGIDSHRWKSDHTGSGIDEIENYLIYRNTIPNVSACVFRRDKFSVTPHLLRMKYCGDWLFWLNLLNGSRLAFHSTALNSHRRHGQSTREVKDLNSEIARLREYWSVIRHGRSLCQKGAVGYGELGRYQWIFEEMFRKRDVIGLCGMLRGLPVTLYPFYLFFYIKKSAHNVVKT